MAGGAEGKHLGWSRCDERDIEGQAKRVQSLLARLPECWTSRDVQLARSETDVTPFLRGLIDGNELRDSSGVFVKAMSVVASR